MSERLRELFVEVEDLEQELICLFQSSISKEHEVSNHDVCAIATVMA